MKNILIVIILIGVCLWLLKKYFQDGSVKQSNENNPDNAKVEPNLPYRKKQYFLTNNEHNFLHSIERIVENKYYVFPQVHFSEIICADGQQNFRNPYFQKIVYKSADFVLFDKQTVLPVLVIEVDDSTHNRSDRVERDDFINSVLEKCGIPIVHVRPFITEEVLRKEIWGKIKEKDIS